MAAAKAERQLDREDARNRIRAAGLRATPGRIATYQVLLAAQAPITHGDVVECLGGRGFDRATIYRNLIDLTDAGLVARADLGDHAWRFELSERAAGGRRDHVHFVCVDCGDVACLSGVDVSIKPTAATPRSVSEKRVEVQLRGLCDACS
jgi:Fur family ferric uptake transcriptional regulator